MESWTKKKFNLVSQSQEGRVGVGAGELRKVFYLATDAGGIHCAASSDSVSLSVCQRFYGKVLSNSYAGDKKELCFTSCFPACILVNAEL